MHKVSAAIHDTMTADNEKRRGPEDDNAEQTAYPPAPWRLRGEALCLFQVVETRQVRKHVPPSLSIVPIFPGKTLAGLYLAHYGKGSTLTYNELIVVPALVWHRGRVGAWVSHIYVDEATSVAGGREIWGVPKEQAEFEVSGRSPRKITVRQGNQVLCTVRVARRRLDMHLPVVFPGFGQREGFVWFQGSGSAKLGLGTGEIDIPPQQPFAFLESGRRVGFHCRELDIVIRAPVQLEI